VPLSNWPANLVLFHIDFIFFLRHHAENRVSLRSSGARGSVGTHFREKPNDETRREEAESRSAYVVHATLDGTHCQYHSAERSDSAVEQFREITGNRSIAWRANFGENNSDSFRFHKFIFHHDGEAANDCGERRWLGVDQHGYRRVPQAGNALVWKDQTWQIHARGGRHQGRIQTGEMRAAL
jgi:hypothetical protein